MRVALSESLAASRTRSPFQVAGLADVWDPEQGVTIATGMSNWTSIAGGKNSVAQGTGANQPILTPAAINGHSAAVFNGTTQLLRGTFARALPRTSFAVAIFNDATTGGLWDGATVNRNRLYRTAATTISCGDGIDGSCTIAGVNVTNWHVHCLVHNGNTSMYRQETGPVTTFLGGTPVCDGLTLGDLGTGFDDWAACSIAYFVDYSVVLSTPAIVGVINWLRHRFAI